MEEQAEARGIYFWDTESTSVIITSVSSTFLDTSAASFFSVSRAVMILSSSRIRPFTSLSVCSKDFSSCLNLSWYSPYKIKQCFGMRFLEKIMKLQTCSFRRSDRFASTSGLSARSTSFKHWDCKEPRVTVKLMNVTREHRSGENSAVGSLVVRKIVKAGERSMSWSPIVISTLPPVRRNSLNEVNDSSMSTLKLLRCLV